MSDKRTQTLVTVITVAAGAVCAAGFGLYSFLNGSPLHPNLQEVPSVADAPPSPAWVDAVDRARQEARAGLVEHNLPGLSVAVGIDGEIVWAEGFGWADLEQRVPVAPRVRFRIGHASKALTSAAVGVLLERGRMRLDDEILNRPGFFGGPIP